MPDGSTTAEAFVFNNTSDSEYGASGWTVAANWHAELDMLTIQPDGTSTVTVLDQANNNVSGGSFAYAVPPGFASAFSSYIPGEVIPDGQGGLMASWTKFDVSGNIQNDVTHINGGSTTTYTIPYTILPNQLVLGDNNTAFAASVNESSNPVQPLLFAFDVNSGGVKWTYQASVDQLTPLAAADGGGFVAKSTTNGVDTVLRFDASGNVTPDTWAASGVGNFGGSFWQGATTASGPLSGVQAAPIQLSTSAWNKSQGTGSNSAPQDILVTNFSTSGDNQATITSTLQKIANALPSYGSCSNWLQGGGTLAGYSGLQQVQAMINTNGTGYGHGTFNENLTAAFSGTVNRSGVASGVPRDKIFTVSDNGPFFNSTYPIGRRNYTGGSLRAQIETLVHETAHQIQVVGFQPDQNDPDAGKANDIMVDEHCRGLIEGPHIKNISPNNGSVGAVVTINGTNFGDPQGNSTVTFNNQVLASPTSWSDSKILVSVPAGATTGNVVVTVGSQSASKNFTVQ
jgi:hypothetical protein